MPNYDTTDLGRVTCSLRGSVTAGSWQTCVLKYTAGFAGIDDTGSIKVVTRYATDSGTPQFDDPSAPNYTTAVASNGAHLRLRYDLKDFRRPWGKTLHLKVLQGYLRKGDSITLTIGDTSAGSPGWRMQTFLEDTFELKTLVDRYATYEYEELSKSPTFRIAAGKPVRLVAVAPSQAAPGKKIVVRWKLEDAWGNPVGKPRRLTHAGFDALGIQRISIRDEETGLSSETNPIRVSADVSPRFWADLHGQSEETIGTNSIESYFRFARDYAFVDACGHQGNDFQITDDFWKTINETTTKFNKDGRFVTFPGWEWSGNTGLGGDRNVFFKDEGGVIHRSSRALVDEQQSADDCSPSVEDLFVRLEKVQQQRDVMLVPHVGGRYADLTRHSPALEPVVEVHSAWGTFEWMLDDAFSRGYRIGIVANSDGHKGRPGASFPGASTFGSYGGLTAILSDRLDRDSVWKAYRQRHVYATTGARILLDVTAPGGLMGDVIQHDATQPFELSFSVAGTAPIERVEVRNGMRVLKTLRTYTTDDLTSRVKLLWEGAEVRGRGRQVNWDGFLTLDKARIRSFETINFWNQEKRCEQRGSRRLQWQSLTTGGVSGVIMELDRLAGEMRVETAQRQFDVTVAKLGVTGRQYKAGGLGKRISADRLPASDGPTELQATIRVSPKQLKPGDNPLYICVVQEDGHMAWSSPIYAVV